jgi:hypothetical protein
MNNKSNTIFMNIMGCEVYSLKPINGEHEKIEEESKRASKSSIFTFLTLLIPSLQHSRNK